MSSATFSIAPAVLTATPPVDRIHHRFWRWLVALLSAVALSPTLLVLPPVWHGAVRIALAWEAARHGCAWTVGDVRGGIFGATRLEGVRMHTASGGTDLSVARASVQLLGRNSFVRLEGICGTLDLASRPAVWLGANWHPAEFSFQGDDLCLRRGPNVLRLLGLSVTGARGNPGTFEISGVRTEGPGFAWTLPGARGRTFWKAGCLALSDVTDHDGMTVANGTLDLNRLGRGRLKWEGSLQLAGGEVRGQGAVNLARADAPLEAAATMRHTTLSSFARLLGVRGPVDGEVEQANFTFRGDPANLPTAQMSLSAHATGFCWEDRRWQSLEVQAVVVNRHVQLNRLDLRQDGNRLALSGECPLPPLDGSALRWTGAGSWWQATGFAGNVDARLENLAAFARLIGPGAPVLAGRMSVNGRLGATAGSGKVEGYLNVEGTRLNVRGAPLDYLRSTLLFRRGAVEIADLQATQDADYFTARGIVGPTTRSGEIRAEVRDASVYLPALAGWPEIAARIAPVRKLDAVLRMENGELIFDRWEGQATESLLAVP